jgi:hypothetical protein
MDAFAVGARRGERHTDGHSARATDRGSARQKENVTPRQR